MFLWRSLLRLSSSRSADGVAVTPLGGSSRRSAQRSCNIFSALGEISSGMQPANVIKTQIYPESMCCINHGHGGAGGVTCFHFIRGPEVWSRVLLLHDVQNLCCTVFLTGQNLRL